LVVKTNYNHTSKDSLKKINPTGILVLEDGSFFKGYGFGFEGITTGEVCFNTSMTGYQEIITDPSYAGQIINFTFPHIGNVGTNKDDNESEKIWVRGLIFNTDITTPSNYRSIKHLDSWLKKNKIKNIKLPVSAPFHSKLMQKARDIMKIEIEKINFSEPKNILISNVTGKEVSKSSEIKDLLIKQIESKVRWRESVKYMIDNGINQFIEIGPGKVLSGLVKRINNNVNIFNINSIDDLTNYINTK